jgi:Ubiquitin-activating enzyme E1 FCCH domain
MFVGFVPIGGTITFPVLWVNSSNVPTNSSSTPTYRVYGNAGFLSGGNLAVKESGSISGATNAAPIVVTSTNHGLTTGMQITISGVTGNTAANGTFQITVIDPNTFSLNGSTGNGAYVAGGTWNTSGLYECSIAALQGNGFAQGLYYDVLVVANIGGNVNEQLLRFGVI